jgi:hypothetical protein
MRWVGRAELETSINLIKKRRLDKIQSLLFLFK